MASRATHVDVSRAVAAATNEAARVDVAAAGAIEAAQRAAETELLPLSEAAGRVAAVAVELAAMAPTDGIARLSR